MKNVSWQEQKVSSTEQAKFESQNAIANMEILKLLSN